MPGAAALSAQRPSTPRPLPHYQYTYIQLWLCACVYASVCEQQLLTRTPDSLVVVCSPPLPRVCILRAHCLCTGFALPLHCHLPGFVKSRGYSARLGADSLQVVPVSKAQARQRSGRAGVLCWCWYSTCVCWGEGEGRQWQGWSAVVATPLSCLLLLSRAGQPID